MTMYVIDLETVTDPEYSSLIKDEWEYPPYWSQKICSFGVAVLKNDYSLSNLTLGCTNNDEKETLEHFVKVAGGHQIVTFNGRGFDIPVIINRAMHYNIQVPWYYQDSEYRYRYSDKKSLDIMDYVADFGSVRGIGIHSLDSISRIMGLPGKVFGSGESIEGLVLAKEFHLLHVYCITDVLLTALTFLKLQYIRGIIQKEQFVLNSMEIYSKLENEIKLEGTGQPSVLGNNDDLQVRSAVVKGCKEFIKEWDVQKYIMGRCSATK